MHGEVSEWFKVQTWNVCVGATSPWVRIPPFPDYKNDLSEVVFFMLISDENPHMANITRHAK